MSKKFPLFQESMKARVISDQKGLRSQREGATEKEGKKKKKKYLSI